MNPKAANIVDKLAAFLALFDRYGVAVGVADGRALAAVMALGRRRTKGHAGGHEPLILVAESGTEISSFASIGRPDRLAT